MSDENMRKLEEILARDNQLRDAQNKKRDDQAALMKQTEAAWVDHRDRKLLPAFGETAEVLKKAGWITNAEKTPRGFKLVIYRGEMLTYQSRERPYLLFELQKTHNIISLTIATPSSVGSASDGYTVEDLTPEKLNSRVVDFVEALAMR